MNYDDILGQPGLVANLRSSMEAGRVVHAYLFAGPEGTGKRTLADICARALNCRGEHRPCDQCPPCKQFLSGNHPDVIRVRPQKSIGVEEIRQVISAVQIRPYEAGRHVVIVEQAEKMTAQAQNALLKTLETPPEDVVFFLLSAAPQGLLTTVISRCRLVRFSAIEEEEAVRALTRQGVGAERARLLARLSQGSVGRALEMERSEEFWKVRGRAVDAISRLKGPADVAVCALMLKEDKDSAHQVLDVLEMWARDLMVMRDAGLEPIEIDLKDRLSSAQLEPERALRAIMEARRRLMSNVAWQSALEMLFMDMVGGK